MFKCNSCDYASEQIRFLRKHILANHQNANTQLKHLLISEIKQKFDQPQELINQIEKITNDDYFRYIGISGQNFVCKHKANSGFCNFVFEDLDHHMLVHIERKHKSNLYFGTSNQF